MDQRERYTLARKASKDNSEAQLRDIILEVGREQVIMAVHSSLKLLLGHASCVAIVILPAGASRGHRPRLRGRVQRPAGRACGVGTVPIAPDAATR